MEAVRPTRIARYPKLPAPSASPKSPLHSLPFTLSRICILGRARAPRLHAMAATAMFTAPRVAAGARRGLRVQNGSRVVMAARPSWLPG